MPKKKRLGEISEKSFAHNAGRYADRAPGPKGALGPPSPWLSAEQKKFWRQMVKSAPSALGESDRCNLEMACLLRWKLVSGRIENREMATLLAVLKALGMCPRNRPPAASPATEQDEFAEFSSVESAVVVCASDLPS